MLSEPLAGWKHVEVTKQRTMKDFAQQMLRLVNQAYPPAPVVGVALDNLKALARRS